MIDKNNDNYIDNNNDVEIDASLPEPVKETKNNRYERTYNCLNSAGFDFKYNLAKDCVEIHGKTPWQRNNKVLAMTNEDKSQLAAFCNEKLGFVPSDRNLTLAIDVLSGARQYDPFKEYLEEIQWDGKARLDELLITFLGADDNPYVRAVTRKTFVAAVARTFEPGIKFDNMLVLVGKQGSGKSTLFSKLAGDDYFTDNLTMTQMKSKDGAEILQGKVIAEVSELAGQSKSEVEDTKAFISRRSDRYREPYGRIAKDRPRRCILVGTTNSNHFLKDQTGNRRIWAVDINVDNASSSVWNLKQEEIDQMWAEAVYYYKNGEKLYLEGDIKEVAEAEQSNHLIVDERIGTIEEYLEIPLPDDWETMDVATKAEYINYRKDKQNTQGKHLRMEVSNIEIWCECFYRSKESLTLRDSKAIAEMMSHMSGWEQTNIRKRIPVYGQQRIYRRL